MSIFRKQDRLNWSLGNLIRYNSQAAEIEKKINAGADVNAIFNDANYNQGSMLWWAAERGRADVIRLLLSRGADPNLDDERTTQPLMEAVQNKGLQSAQALLEGGAKANIRSATGETPLIRAARNGSADIVKLLIEHGADLNVQLKDGNTALHLAAAQGYANLATYLIEKGADATLANSNLNSAADVAEKEYPALAAMIRGKLQPERPAPLPEDTGWLRLSEDEVAHVTTKEPIGYRITEIFNFSARTYTHIASNLDSRAESQSVKSFSELESVEFLERAREELVKRGGRVDGDIASKKRLQAPAQ